MSEKKFENKRRASSTLQVYSHCYQRNSWNSKYSQTHQKVVQCCKLKFQITPTKRCYPENFSLQKQDWLETFCWSQKNCLNRNEEIAKSCITIYGVYFYDRMLPTLAERFRASLGKFRTGILFLLLMGELAGYIDTFFDKVLIHYRIRLHINATVGKHDASG